MKVLQAIGGGKMGKGRNNVEMHQLCAVSVHQSILKEALYPPEDLLFLIAPLCKTHTSESLEVSGSGQCHYCQIQGSLLDTHQMWVTAVQSPRSSFTTWDQTWRESPPNILLLEAENPDGIYNHKKVKITEITDNLLSFSSIPKSVAWDWLLTLLHDKKKDNVPEQNLF